MVRICQDPPVAKRETFGTEISRHVYTVIATVKYGYCKSSFKLVCTDTRVVCGHL